MGARPDTDAALDYYNAIVGVIEGQVKAAKCVTKMNAALGPVLTGVWLSIEAGTLHAAFQLRPLPDDPTRPNALAQILGEDFAGRKFTLASREPIDPPRSNWPKRRWRCGTRPHTNVCVPYGDGGYYPSLSAIEPERRGARVRVLGRRGGD